MAEQSAPIASLKRVLQWGPSVCQIQAPNDSGTGFLVTPTLIMTCAHVIATAEKAKNAYAHFSNKICVKLNPDGFFYSQPCYQGKTLTSEKFDDSHQDFALVAIEPHEKLKGVVPFPIFQSILTPQLNRDAYLLHHPVAEVSQQTKEITVLPLEQRVSSREEAIQEIGQFAIHFRCESFGGSSGAPVMNGDGEIYGMHHGRCADVGDQHKNCKIALRLDKITRFISSNMLLYPFLGEQIKAQLQAFYLKDPTIKLLLGGKELPIETIYTSLAIITENEKQNKDKETKENLDGRIPTYESIFQPKEPIALEDVFKRGELKNASQKKLLIQGSAGIGKSTLCHHIAHRWAKGGLWPEFKAIFWIKFRYLNEKRYLPSIDHSIYDVIARECGIEAGEIKALMESQPLRENSLLILDGYDEFSHAGAFKSSGKPLTLLEAFQKEFPHILITTRPQEVRGFQSAVKLEILGFEQEGIQKYIDRFFPQDKLKEKIALQAHLNAPLVNSLCHIPINLEIFCSVSLEGKVFSKKSVTITTIYQALVEWLIERFGIERLNISLKTGTGINAIQKRTFVERVLEEIAWDMMESDHLYISLNRVQAIVAADFAQEKTNPNIEIDQIGPLRFDHGEGCFIHLTFQEFFAAKYLARKFNKSPENAEKILAEKKFHPRYRIVIWMTAGLLSNEEEGKIYFNALYEEPRDLAKTAELILFAQCFEECKDPTLIQQYEDFIREVGEFHMKPVMAASKIDLFRGNYKLFHQKNIIERFTRGLVDMQEAVEIYEILRDAVKHGQSLPKEIYNKLMEALVDPNVDSMSKNSAIDILGSIAKRGEDDHAKAVIENLNKVISDDAADFNTKGFAARVLGEIIQEKQIHTQQTLKELTKILEAPGANLSSKQFATEALGHIAKQKQEDAQKAIQYLTKVFNNPNADFFSKQFAAEALKEVANEGQVSCEEILQVLEQFSKNPADFFAQKLVVDALTKVVRRGEGLPPAAVEWLTLLLNDTKIDFVDKSSVIWALEKVIAKGGELPENSIKELIILLNNSEIASYQKRGAVYILGKVAGKGNELSEKAIQWLTETFNSPKVDSDMKGAVVYALSEVATGGLSLPKEILNGLAKLLTDSKATFFAKSHAAYALKEVAKWKHVFSEEILIDLTQLLKNPKTEPGVKGFVAYVIGEVAKRRQSCTYDALKQAYTITGQAFFFSKGKYYVSDRREQIEVIPKKI